TITHANGTPQYQCEPDRHPMTITGRATSQQKPPSRRTRSAAPVSDEVKKTVARKTTSQAKPSRKWPVRTPPRAQRFGPPTRLMRKRSVLAATELARRELSRSAAACAPARV